MADTHDEPVRAGGLDRRQLLKAGAWAAPVVVLAAATPAASASNRHTLELVGPTAHFAFGDDSAKTGITGYTNIQVPYSEPSETIDGISLVVQFTAIGISDAMAPAGAEFDESTVNWHSSTMAPVSADIVSYTLTWEGALVTDGKQGLTEVKFTVNAREEVDLGSLGSIGWTMIASARNANSASASGPEVALDG